MNKAEISKIVTDVVKTSANSSLPANFETKNFSDLEIDSLNTVEIIVDSMKKTNIKIPREQYRHIKCTQDLVDFLAGANLKT